MFRRGIPIVRRAAIKRTIFGPSSSALAALKGVPSSASLLGARTFSSEAQGTLLKILSREEAEERDSGNLEMPPELANLKATLEQNWKIVEDGATTNLFMKDKKVQVSFHCQDTVEADEQYHEEDGDELEEEEAASVRFCVTVSKAGKTLVINCVSEYGEAKIEEVITTATTADAIHGNQGDLTEKAQFQGPDFLELAEDLQGAFLDYLEFECGVNSDLASFVAMYTDYREQMQYVQFLKDAQAIIS